MSVVRPDERARAGMAVPAASPRSGVYVQLLELRRRFAAVSALSLATVVLISSSFVRPRHGPRPTSWSQAPHSRLLRPPR